MDVIDKQSLIWSMAMIAPFKIMRHVLRAHHGETDARTLEIMPFIICQMLVIARTKIILKRSVNSLFSNKFTQQAVSI